MNMIKKNGGFTLVELIVVIAILAILAGVTVPAYSGYISKANEAADYTWLDSAKTAIVFEVMEETPEAKVTGATITFAADNSFSTSATVGEGDDAASVDVDITDYVGDTYDTKSGATTAVWNGEKWELDPETDDEG